MLGHALASFDDGTGNGPSLYAAGEFGSIGGIDVNNIAKWNGTNWLTVNEGISQADFENNVNALAAYQPTNGDPPILFAGGNFTNTVVGDNYLVAYVGCPTRPQCAAADINCDGSVNVVDLLSVINAWGACPAPPAKCSADIAPPPDGDGQINVADLLMIINNWG